MLCSFIWVVCLLWLGCSFFVVLFVRSFEGCLVFLVCCCVVILCCWGVGCGVGVILVLCCWGFGNCWGCLFRIWCLGLVSGWFVGFGVCICCWVGESSV